MFHHESIVAWASRMTVTQQQRREVSTVGVAQTSTGIVIIGKEKSGITTIPATLVERSVHRHKQVLKVFKGQREEFFYRRQSPILAAKVGLQVRH